MGEDLTTVFFQYLNTHISSHAKVNYFFVKEPTFEVYGICKTVINVYFKYSYRGEIDEFFVFNSIVSDLNSLHGDKNDIFIYKVIADSVQPDGSRLIKMRYKDVPKPLSTEDIKKKTLLVLDRINDESEYTGWFGDVCDAKEIKHDLNRFISEPNQYNIIVYMKWCNTLWKEIKEDEQLIRMNNIDKYP